MFWVSLTPWREALAVHGWISSFRTPLGKRQVVIVIVIGPLRYYWTPRLTLTNAVDFSHNIYVLGLLNSLARGACRPWLDFLFQDPPGETPSYYRYCWTPRLLDPSVVGPRGSR